MVNRLSFRKADGPLLCETRLPDREISLMVGRTPDGGVILPVSAISRHHRAVHRTSDGALYQAKKDGRHRVVLAPGPAARGGGAGRRREGKDKEKPLRGRAGPAFPEVSKQKGGRTW